MTITFIIAINTIIIIIIVIIIAMRARGFRSSSLLLVLLLLLLGLYIRWHACVDLMNSTHNRKCP